MPNCRTSPPAQRWDRRGEPAGVWAARSRPGRVRLGVEMRGFTLLEVLLAVAIFAIVLVAIHTVFYGAVRLRNQTTEALEQGLPVQQTLAIIKRDLANIVMPSGTFFGELVTTRAGSSLTNTLDSLSPANDSIPGLSSPAFFTASGRIQDSAPWGEVVRVSYFLAPPTNHTAGQDLIRSVTRNLLPIFEEQPENQWLMSGLERIDFYYYDGLQWRDHWDSTAETAKLPRGIKVELQLVSEDARRFREPPIELVVPIMAQAGTNLAANAEGGEL